MLKYFPSTIGETLSLVVIFSQFHFPSAVKRCFDCLGAECRTAEDGRTETCARPDDVCVTWKHRYPNPKEGIKVGSVYRKGCAWLPNSMDLCQPDGKYIRCVCSKNDNCNARTLGTLSTMTTLNPVAVAVIRPQGRTFVKPDFEKPLKIIKAKQTQYKNNTKTVSTSSIFPMKGRSMGNGIDHDTIYSNPAYDKLESTSANRLSTKNSIENSANIFHPRKVLESAKTKTKAATSKPIKTISDIFRMSSNKPTTSAIQSTITSINFIIQTTKNIPLKKQTSKRPSTTPPAWTSSSAKSTTLAETALNISTTKRSKSSIPIVDSVFYPSITTSKYTTKYTTSSSHVKQARKLNSSEIPTPKISALIMQTKFFTSKMPTSKVPTSAIRTTNSATKKSISETKHKTSTRPTKATTTTKNPLRKLLSTKTATLEITTSTKLTKGPTKTARIMYPKSKNAGSIDSSSPIPTNNHLVLTTRKSKYSITSLDTTKGTATRILTTESPTSEILSRKPAIPTTNSSKPQTTSYTKRNISRLSTSKDLTYGITKTEAPTLAIPKSKYPALIKTPVTKLNTWVTSTTINPTSAMSITKRLISNIPTINSSFTTAITTNSQYITTATEKLRMPTPAGKRDKSPTSKSELPNSIRQRRKNITSTMPAATPRPSKINTWTTLTSTIATTKPSSVPVPPTKVRMSYILITTLTSPLTKTKSPMSTISALVPSKVSPTTESLESKITTAECFASTISATPIGTNNNFVRKTAIRKISTFKFMSSKISNDNITTSTQHTIKNPSVEMQPATSPTTIPVIPFSLFLMKGRNMENSLYSDATTDFLEMETATTQTSTAASNKTSKFATPIMSIAKDKSTKDAMTTKNIKMEKEKKLDPEIERMRNSNKRAIQQRKVQQHLQQLKFHKQKLQKLRSGRRKLRHRGI